jgi:hypothetical protein
MSSYSTVHEEETQEELFSLYLSSLNDREIKAYHIAKDHLGMSFTMERSNGYKQWKKTRDENIAKLQAENNPSN